MPHASEPMPSFVHGTRDPMYLVCNCHGEVTPECIDVGRAPQAFDAKCSVDAPDACHYVISSDAKRVVFTSVGIVSTYRRSFCGSRRLRSSDGAIRDEHLTSGDMTKPDL